MLLPSYRTSRRVNWSLGRWMPWTDLKPFLMILSCTCFVWWCSDCDSIFGFSVVFELLSVTVELCCCLSWPGLSGKRDLESQWDFSWLNKGSIKNKSHSWCFFANTHSRFLRSLCLLDTFWQQLEIVSGLWPLSKLCQQSEGTKNNNTKSTTITTTWWVIVTCVRVCVCACVEMYLQNMRGKW